MGGTSRPHRSRPFNKPELPPDYTVADAAWSTNAQPSGSTNPRRLAAPDHSTTAVILWPVLTFLLVFLIGCLYVFFKRKEHALAVASDEPKIPTEACTRV